MTALPQEARLRRFGTEPGDLDVDFATGDRSSLVTELLRCATVLPKGEIPDAGAFWRLPVGVRLGALIDLCRHGGAERLAWSLRCPADECGELVELGLPLDELARRADAARGREPQEFVHGGTRWSVRLPTGDDLRRWGARPEAPPSDAEMLLSLLRPVSDDEPVSRTAPPPMGEVSAALLATAEAALAAADPLVDVRVESACPVCGTRLEVPVDVREEALALLARAQEDLFRQVGVLAAAFHWSEREILGLPEDRRRRYLELARSIGATSQEGT